LDLILKFIFQIVEPFTAHYDFVLGVAGFLSCAHWVLQVCQILNFSKSFYQLIL